MVNIKKFVAAGPLENDIRKPRCSPEVAKPLGTRLWTQQILDQVISANKRDGGMKVRAPDPGLKQQASSFKRQAFEPTCSSIKRQASSPKLQASSVKPQAASSLILDPRNMDIGEVLEEQGPRAFIMINVLSG